jgi:hypothetical protein
MILAIAALLLQIPAIPLNSISTVSRAVPDGTGPVAPETATVKPDPVIPQSPDSAATSELPTSETSSPRPDLSARGKTPIPDHFKDHQRRNWLALTIAQHSAATFDAWSTRQAISSGRAQELDPVLRPFAGNASLYAAVQVGPLLFDYLGRRMMASQHVWMRRTWWIPQVLSTTAFFFGGAHNMSIQ